MGTAERRIRIMKILCQRRHDTISNLSFELGVSKKTISRDIIALSDEPIYTKSGKYGGVYVIDNYTLDRMYMSCDEINLLLKIKDIVSTKLCENDLVLYEKIINSYTKPIVK